MDVPCYVQTLASFYCYKMTHKTVEKQASKK